MSVKRFDIGSLRKPERTPQGFLRVDAYLTRANCIFEYRRPDGGVRRELRRSDDVFAGDALGSFSMVPVTDDHPPEMLEPDNVREYQRGHLGESVRRDGDFVRASMLVTDAALIAKMEAGKHQVSCGYTCDLDETPGEFRGERYDAVQTNIRGNHVAVVDLGRAGAACAVRMDSGDAFGGAPVSDERNTQMDEKLKELQSKLDAALAEISKLRTDADKATARADAADAELAKERQSRKDSDDAIPARVRARVALEKTAGAVLGDDVKLDGMTDRDVKVAVIEKVQGGKVPAEKSDAYVDGRFDAAVEGKSGDALAQLRVVADGAARGDGVDDNVAAKAMAKMKADAANAWKSK